MGMKVADAPIRHRDLLEMNQEAPNLLDLHEHYLHWSSLKVSPGEGFKPL
jgi:hypothetical protein